MQAHRRIIVLLLTTSLTLFAPSEAGFSSWSWEKTFGRPTAPWPGKINNGGTINSFNHDGDGNVDFTGTQINTGGFDQFDGCSGDEYLLNRRRLMDNRSCIEEIKLVWNREKVGKTFKPKCLKTGYFRNVYCGKAVLIIGSPNEDFCAFSSRVNEYFYKENGKWKKGNINGNKINEVEMESTEITKVTEGINKWKEVTDKFISNVKNIAEEQMKEGRRTSDESRRIANLMNAAARSYQQNLQELQRQRYKELQEQRQEQARINTMLLAHGWNNDLQNAENEMEIRAQQVENDIRAKGSAENSRYMQVIQDLNNQMILENERHQQEMHKLHQQYDHENARFDQECQEMINQGY